MTKYLYSANTPFNTKSCIYFEYGTFSAEKFLIFRPVVFQKPQNICNFLFSCLDMRSIPLIEQFDQDGIRIDKYEEYLSGNKYLGRGRRPRGPGFYSNMMTNIYAYLSVEGVVR
jgi:hypothetical protein